MVSSQLWEMTSNSLVVKSLTFKPPNTWGGFSSVGRAAPSRVKTTGETRRLSSFSTFVQKSTSEIRKKFHCQDVEFSVELTDGHVKLKAKAKA